MIILLCFTLKKKKKPVPSLYNKAINNHAVHNHKMLVLMNVSKYMNS